MSGSDGKRWVGPGLMGVGAVLLVGSLLGGANHLVGEMEVRAEEIQQAADEQAVYVLEGLGDPGDTPGIEEAERRAGGVRQIQLDEPIRQDQLARMDVAELEGDLVVPSVGLSTGMREMNIVDGIINPPSLYSAYRIRDYGYPGPDEMAVVVLHSIYGASNVPGSLLIDPESGRATVGAGDSVSVQGQGYVIESVSYPEKWAASRDDELWADEAGKLLLITCLQRPDGTSVENVFITARAV